MTKYLNRKCNNGHVIIYRVSYLLWDQDRKTVCNNTGKGLVRLDENKVPLEFIFNGKSKSYLLREKL